MSEARVKAGGLAEGEVVQLVEDNTALILGARAHLGGLHSSCSGAKEAPTYCGTMHDELKKNRQ